MIPTSRITPELVTRLEPNQVFVMGTNRAGRHGRGAAKTARKWGAVNGTGEGLMGQTYGIPTKGRKLEVLTVREIGLAVDRFLRYASVHPETRFLVTAIGTGLAGHSARDIAPLFLGLPDNVSLPLCFWKVIAPHFYGTLTATTATTASINPHRS